MKQIWKSRFYFQKTAGYRRVTQSQSKQETNRKNKSNPEGPKSGVPKGKSQSCESTTDFTLSILFGSIQVITWSKVVNLLRYVPLSTFFFTENIGRHITPPKTVDQAMCLLKSSIVTSATAFIHLCSNYANTKNKYMVHHR